MKKVLLPRGLVLFLFKSMYCVYAKEPSQCDGSFLKIENIGLD